MAKLMVTGIRTYDFLDKENNRQVKGMSVFYHKALENKDGNAGRGYMTEKFSVAAGTDVYNKLLALPVGEAPVECDFRYDIIPNVKNPVCVDVIYSPQKHN